MKNEITKVLCIVNDGQIKRVEMKGDFVTIVAAIGMLVENLSEASGKSSEYIVRGMLYATGELQKERETYETLRD